MASSSSVSSDQIPLWMSKALINHEDEVKNGKPRLMEDEARAAIWNLCGFLNVDQHGIPGQSCRLYERYLYLHLKDLRSFTFKSQEELEEFKETMMSGRHITLNMVSCVQLASKMTKVDSLMTAKHVQEVIQNKLGYRYYISEILASEFKVFKTFGCQISLWTSLDVAQMIAKELLAPLSIMYGLELIMNIAEYRRPRISRIVRNLSNKMHSTSLINPHGLATLHLIGGAIAATAVMIPLNIDPDLVTKLGELTRAPTLYIQCVRDVILSEVLVVNATTVK